MTNELSRGFRYPVNEFRNFRIAVRASSTPREFLAGAGFGAHLASE
tara:strand:+ start:390 stop:527 length:138 start_codon:yes stop_codon:yes gene_type:complete